MDPNQNTEELKDDVLDIVVEGQEEETKPEVAVVDDTPPEDRNRKPLGHDALSVDDEAEQYSEKIKRRLGELRHQAHDERRAREAAQRERDEAVKITKAAYERMKQLEQRLNSGEATFAQEYGSKAQLALEVAKEKHRRAYEAGNPDEMAEAVEQLAEAKQQLANAQRWRQEAEYKIQNSALQQDEDVVDSQSSHQQQTQAPAADPLAVQWSKQNPWFGSDPIMTSMAYGVHEHLIRSGIDPRTQSSSYYAAIDKEMRRRFPDYEWGSDADNDTSGRATQTRKPAPATVAPVTRTTSGSKNKITLTKTQVAMAEKLGLTLEQYARELQKLKEA